MPFTIRVAAVLATVPAALLNTARYWLPFWRALARKVNVVAVAPGILMKVAPPSLLTCHWTVGAGSPVVAAVKVTRRGREFLQKMREHRFGLLKAMASAWTGVETTVERG